MALGLAATAFAADQSYVHQGTFSSEGPEDGQMIHPRRSAVENSTGNLLVADRDNGRIVVFAPQAGGAGFLTSFSEGLSRPFGVAVDQSTGDVYVSDGTAGKILRYTSDGEPTPAYTLDNTFASPAAGSGAGEVGDLDADLAVDPTSGELLVLDAANDRVNRYDRDGGFIASFDGADSPDGAFVNLLDLDVAPDGDIYVVDSEGPVFIEGVKEGEEGSCQQSNYCAAEPSRVLRFDPAGAYQSTVQGLVSSTAGAVAVDPVNGQVLVGLINPQGRKKVDVYRSASQPSHRSDRVSEHSAVRLVHLVPEHRRRG